MQDDDLEDFEVPSTRAPGRGKGAGRKRGEGWTNDQFGRLLAVRKNCIGYWLNGITYPTTKNLKKIEAIFGWPASEQIDLIPLEGKDLRYSMVFRRVLNEWAAANPRTVTATEILTAARTNTRK